MSRIFTRVLPAAALALLAAVSSGNAQGGPGGGRGMMRNPVQVLVDSAQSLGLSADQVSRVTAIAQELQTRNAAPLDSLQAHRGEMGGMMMGGEMTPEQRAAMERLRPLMQQVRDNNRQAMERAMAVLTADQQEHARAMMPQRRGPGGPGGPPQP
ncbi:hypothetical protein [Longimicrobium sp.]|uniref:hypothetical protein n=1 Tax=Longimicrobium sp. TaxID=2029185 RepID=UPI002B5C89E5|nr:hypothetical protein [Longimicrobium sp.]HSU17182.1 hypothetical protein [Longimicrobium sp.]